MIVFHRIRTFTRARAARSSVGRRYGLDLVSGAPLLAIRFVLAELFDASDSSIEACAARHEAEAAALRVEAAHARAFSARILRDFDRVFEEP